MSRIFEALQQANPQLTTVVDPGDESLDGAPGFVAALTGQHEALEDVPAFPIPQAPANRLVAWTDPNSLAAENLRIVSSRLRQSRQRRKLKVLLVTSAVRGDGKSVASANLAITLAMHGEKTLLIDGDLHKPALASYLGTDDSGGFATWHTGATRVTQFLQHAHSLPLWFLPSGKCRPQPLTLIQSSKTAELLKQLSNWFSWIVIDSPPLLPLADSSIWANMSDGIFVVARQGVTPKKALKKSVASIDKSKILGMIMNDADASEERYYRAYYSTKEASHLSRAEEMRS